MKAHALSKHPSLATQVSFAEKSGNGSFTFLQILILLQDIDILKYIVHNHKDFLKPVSIASGLKEEHVIWMPGIPFLIQVF